MNNLSTQAEKHSDSINVIITLANRTVPRTTVGTDSFPLKTPITNICSTLSNISSVPYQKFPGNTVSDIPKAVPSHRALSRWTVRQELTTPASAFQVKRVLFPRSRARRPSTFMASTADHWIFSVGLVAPAPFRYHALQARNAQLLLWYLPHRRQAHRRRFCTQSLSPAMNPLQVATAITTPASQPHPLSSTGAHHRCY